MTVRTAIIGLGIMGRRMLEHMVAHEGYEPALLWDPDPAACAQARDLAPGSEIAQSAEAAIAGADLVYLACPPVPRKALALMAAEAGKAVFLEKPLGVDIAASEDLVARLAATGVPVAVNFTQAASLAMTAVTEAARTGAMGALVGADIVVTYGAWPRAWQKAADWLRFRDEGGMTREVISHFLFVSERVLGPLTLTWARPSYPADTALCETHMLARLETAEGLPVTVMASVGGAQPDRQELTLKGARASHRISDFYVDAVSDGGPFHPVERGGVDPRSGAIRAQLDEFLALIEGKASRLATPQEALRVQKLVEAMLAGKGG
ncbi:MAG: putative dehydrogenase [Rhodobacteraceae bacterium HLUCCO07]|nr:MAG: putative dehydrogenase [Rhodobacteraceae bacterium HLUCCO07]